ncbi:MAG: hypothetical protein J6U86_00270 [Clostridia bacterium]|nr:hypothetical protein [Clostridia bacterium]
MKTKRIISSFLAVLMLIGAFTVVMSAEESTQYEYNTSNAKPTIDYLTGNAVVYNQEKKIYEVDPNTKVITTAESKLETMDLRFEKDGYQLYVDEYSGEVATRCIATGEILFSNPYTIGESTANAATVKTRLLSQLAVKYVDVTSGDENTYYSYEWAATRGQIISKNIKNGVRMEYTIGREEARMLVPELIEKESFETKILSVIEAAAEEDAGAKFALKQIRAYYQIKDPNNQASASMKAEIQRAYPITKKMAIYALDSTTTTVEKARLETYIKTYCPDYTYENLDDDHLLTEYESEDKNPPLFKMALEYTLDSKGLTVRLPANGIRFNEALYQLYSIEILPYMGTASKSNASTSFAYKNSGYTFFPDGSGTLFDFEKITNLGASTTVTGKVYGQDYAYHTISGTHQEIIRYPVFGLVETENLTQIEKVATAKKDSSATEATTATNTETVEDNVKTRGFVAIVEEGDALMEISSNHAVVTSEYNNIRMTVYPRPQDTYNVADSISVGQNDTWTVVSSRKYTGNYKIRYIMLTDDAVAAQKGVTDYYECTYVGMAKAYREYLENNQVLTRLTEDDVKANVPVYIETFGALKTTERFLSIPVEVMTPLTTFDNLKTMYDELSNKGVENINFILTGYTKGGISDPQVPYHLKWDNAVEDDMDFEDLLAYANEEDFGIYPDFDFAYVQGDGMFDGLSLKKHAVKTIDDRYSSKREYSATKQTYVSYFELAVSPAYFSHFYEKLTEEYLEYNPTGISVSTLGNSLNSDFDEDEPYNREDSKEFTVKAFEYLSENYDKVMTSGGNAYTWKYVDYITDVALDSSRYSQSAASVPFLGIVLHGYVEIAGTPTNMEGNIDYAVLKAIENGASLKFILSYQNTNNLKNYETLSQYYSVRYDIWLNDVAELYKEVNEALAGVQTSIITEHKFVEKVTRVPDDDELINDASAAIDAVLSGEDVRKDKEIQLEKDTSREARLEVERIYNKFKKDAERIDSGVKTNKVSYLEGIAFFDGNGTTVEEYTSNLDSLINAATNNPDDTEALEALKKQLELYLTGYISAASSAEKYLNDWVTYSTELNNVNGKYKARIEQDYTSGKLPQAQYDALMDQIAEINALNATIEAESNIEAFVNGVVTKIAGIQATLNEYVAELTAEGALLASYKDTIATSATKFTYEWNQEEDDAENIVAGKVEPTTYAPDDNKVVYEAYENGTVFLLNFNNYKVKVTLEDANGVKSYYTIDAYGYVILKRGN